MIGFTGGSHPLVVPPSDIGQIKQLLDYSLDSCEISKANGEGLDLKACEGDMWPLIDTYFEAEEPLKISPFDNVSLLELIVRTGIARAFASQLNGLIGDKNAIGKTIENNMRGKIIKEHLNAPAYYERISPLLVSHEDWLYRLSIASVQKPQRKTI